MADIVIQLLPHILAAVLYAALGFHFWNTRWRENERQSVARPMQPWERSAIAVALLIPMSIIVTPYGVKTAHALPKRRLELLLGAYLVFVAVRFGWSLL